MAFQPLYGRVTDNQGGCGHTLSLRGRVDQISMWLNSWFGEVLSVSARLIDGKEIVPKPDLRKVKRKDRMRVAKEYEEQVAKENKVVVDIDIPAKKEFSVRINGIELGYERLKMMEKIQSRRTDKMIASFQKMRNADANVLKMAEVIHSE